MNSLQLPLVIHYYQFNNQVAQEIIVFGRCDVGQNGHGVEQESSVARIPLRNVIKLSSGWGHTLALTKGGKYL